MICRVAPLLVVLVAACARQSQEPQRAPFQVASVSVVEMEVGVAALAAFEPAREVVLEGGECTRNPLRDEEGEALMAYFPSRTAPETRITVALGPDGEMLRYSEARGVERPPTTPQELRDFKRRRDAMVRTIINLDHGRNRATVRNEIPGKTNRGVLGTVAEFENSSVLGDLRARVSLVRRLCDAPAAGDLLIRGRASGTGPPDTFAILPAGVSSWRSPAFWSPPSAPQDHERLP